MDLSQATVLVQSNSLSSLTTLAVHRWLVCVPTETLTVGSWVVVLMEIRGVFIIVWMRMMMKSDDIITLIARRATKSVIVETITMIIIKVMVIMIMILWM